MSNQQVPPVLSAYRASDYYDQLNVFNYLSLVKLIGDSSKFSFLEPTCKNQDKVIEKRKAMAVKALIDRYAFEPFDPDVEVACADMVPYACCGIDYSEVSSRTQTVEVDEDELVIPITHRFVKKTTGDDAEALTLADGTTRGQRLNVLLVDAGGGVGTITPVSPNGFATVALENEFDMVEFEWTVDGWIIVGLSGAAIA